MFLIKCACQALFVVVAKLASMFDEQSSKCLANNVCLFGWGLNVNIQGVPKKV